ncbi:STAS domain-containing protein [Streptomyces sp. NPDC086033]|uniref:STAS domain-containing protein n=1 Tax=Streptomyces sp. NPDC086033 TaxID=3365747 RepID=UPI0037D467D9
MSVRAFAGSIVIRVNGEIDWNTAPKLREELADVINQGNYHLIVDLELVDYLDSTGLVVLSVAARRVRAHDGSLRLVCNQERILRIFRITGLTKIFSIHPSVEEAAAAFD